jgi:hypothetical protein
MKLAWIEGRKRVGPWKVRWRETVDGITTKKASHMFHNHGEADDWRTVKAEQLEKARELSGRMRGLSMTVDVAIDRWTKDQLANGEIGLGYAAEVRGYWNRLCKANKWTTLRDITADSVVAWRSTATGGVRKPVIVLCTVLRWLQGTLRQPIDPAVLTLTIGPSPHRIPPVLQTDAQIAEIHALADDHGESVGTLVRHLSVYGCRPVDCCRLVVGCWNGAHRELTHRKTKNGRSITHEVDADFAARFDRLCAGRGAKEPLYLRPGTDQGWSVDETRAGQYLSDWYWNHIGSKVVSLQPNQRGIYCLKDYAISVMEQLGIEDRTKALFTAHLTLASFEHYKSTNRERARIAVDILAARRKIGGKPPAPEGAKLGATRISGAKPGGRKPNRTKRAKGRKAG